MKGFKTVSEPVKLVAKTLCLFFFVKPKMENGPDGRTKVANYWEACKAQLLNATLLKNLKEYKKDDMTDELVD